MLFSRREIGNRYEALAKKYLTRRGLTFIEENFLAKTGELDLIMREQQTIVFVEVKYRRGESYGHAAEFVDYRKQRKLIKTAYFWLKQRKLSPHDTSFRFDVIAIHNRGKDINWIKNAITEG